MRLLRTDTEELELVTFNNEQKLPKYAILSHTWLKDDKDEISFADLAKSVDTKTRPGRKKVDFAKKEAVARGFGYVWIDTCCIDKSSSAELSEAINSMFRWYRNAEECYVYLEDMPDDVEFPEKFSYVHGAFRHRAPDCYIGGTSNSLSAPQATGTLDGDVSHLINAEDTQDVSDAVAALAQCKWFTRGWTLQELIAPKHVYFFAKSWRRPIGRLKCLFRWENRWGNGWEKAPISTDFSRLISSITGIHEPVLFQETRLGKYSIAQRMSWAASRDTTRIEDRAYSLLGIFDINMPLLYGEGGKAFERLQLEVIRSSSDQTIFAWESDTRRMQEHMSLLAPYPDYFAHLKDLVRVRDREQGGYEVSSKGISLYLPMIPHNCRASNGKVRFGMLGMLACRRENDYTRAVALHLCSTLRNNHVSGFEQHYYACGLVDLDLHEVAQVAPRHVLIQLQRTPMVVPGNRWSRGADSAKMVFRCTGLGVITNDVNTADAEPRSYWSNDRRAFEIQLSKPLFGHVHPRDTDIPWMPRMVHRDTGFGVHYNFDSSSNNDMETGQLLYNHPSRWHPSVPTPTDPNFAGRLALTCGGQQCAILLVSAAAAQSKDHTSETTRVYDFRVLNSEHDIAKDSKTRHRELNLHDPALTRRTLLSNGLLISAEAKNVLFNDEEVILVEIKAMRLVSSPTSRARRRDLYSRTSENTSTVWHLRRAPRPNECYICGIAWCHSKDLARHMRDVHAPPRLYRCNHYGCNYTTWRRDKMREHCYRAHGQAVGDADFTMQDIPTEVDRVQ